MYNNTRNIESLKMHMYNFAISETRTASTFGRMSCGKGEQKIIHSESHTYITRLTTWHGKISTAK